MSIKNQMQMRLQFAEAQEEEFRQLLRLKRKRVETLRQQQPPARAPAGEADEAKMVESSKDKEAGGGASASTINRKQSEEEADFLLIFRQ